MDGSSKGCGNKLDLFAVSTVANFRIKDTIVRVCFLKVLNCVWGNFANL